MRTRWYGSLLCVGVSSATVSDPCELFNRGPGGVLGGTGWELLRTFLEPCALEARLESFEPLYWFESEPLRDIERGVSEVARRCCCRLCVEVVRGGGPRFDEREEGEWEEVG